MIIVQLSGGLGNQMFQYALYRRLKYEGKEVKIDDITCYSEKNTRNKQLCHFQLEYERASQKEIIKMTDASMNPFLRLKRKVRGRRDLSYREASFNVDKEIFKKDEVYLEGCFQTEKYFEPVKELLKSDFRFKEEAISGKCRAILSQMEKTESVSIHVRRGDYLSQMHAPLYGNICTEEYYIKAISYIKEKYPQAIFYVFTNEVEWAKKNIKEASFRVVDCSDEDTGYLDMYLMSHCRHNIIANSSFSWWGAWLNENTEKTVIAPPKWLNGRDCEDIYTEAMLVL